MAWTGGYTRQDGATNQISKVVPTGFPKGLNIEYKKKKNRIKDTSMFLFPTTRKIKLPLSKMEKATGRTGSRRKITSSVLYKVSFRS